MDGGQIWPCLLPNLAEALVRAWEALVVVVRPWEAARSKATETLEASNILDSSSFTTMHCTGLSLGLH